MAKCKPFRLHSIHLFFLLLARNLMPLAKAASWSRSECFNLLELNLYFRYHSRNRASNFLNLTECIENIKNIYISEEIYYANIFNNLSKTLIM